MGYPALGQLCQLFFVVDFVLFCAFTHVVQQCRVEQSGFNMSPPVNLVIYTTWWFKMNKEDSLDSGLSMYRPCAFHIARQSMGTVDKDLVEVNARAISFSNEIRGSLVCQTKTSLYQHHF